LRPSARPSRWATGSWSKDRAFSQFEYVSNEIALSEEFAASGVSTNSVRTLLASSENGFIWASIAHIHGIPAMPDWADWFAGELQTHRPILPALGIGCDPVIVKGQKEQFLDWLSWGVESDAIPFPADTGSIHWPSMSLENIFPQAE
jgi:hypothetical protein